MDLQKKLKLALSENRLLILGTQVLFGFQFSGVFQDRFATLPYLSRALEASGLTLLMLSIGSLIAPSMYHRIVDGGRDSTRVLALATDFGGFALLPLSIALSFDSFAAVASAIGPTGGAAFGAAFFLIAISLWYIAALLLRRKKATMTKDSIRQTPLDAQVDQLLTEARLIIPGAQALLGFQLAVTFTRAFADLPPGVKLFHVAALCCIGIAVILLMAPASIHRIAFGGEDDSRFMKIGSILVIGAPLPLAFGIALDTYVAGGQALDSSRFAAVLAIAAIIILLGTWYGYPLAQRLSLRRNPR